MSRVRIQDPATGERRCCAGFRSSCACPRVPLAGHLAPAYTPNRVYDTRKKQFIDFETLASRLAAADLVFVGEQHDDPATHRMELAILEGVARRRDSVTLAMEMFERDVQPLLDRYLAGSTTEASCCGRLVPGRTTPRTIVPWSSWRAPAGGPSSPATRRGRWPRSWRGRGCPGSTRWRPAAVPTRPPRSPAPRTITTRNSWRCMGDMSAHGPSGAPPDDGRARLTRCTRPSA
jgi:hypothetical protein